MQCVWSGVNGEYDDLRAGDLSCGFGIFDFPFYG